MQNSTENVLKVFEWAGSFSSDLLLSPVLPNFILVCIVFRYLVAWKIKHPFPYSNFVVFSGQMLLAASLLFCIQSLIRFHSSSFYRSFIYCSISCCLSSFSMLISYDFRNPPNQTFGLVLSGLGTVVNIYSALHIYDSKWSYIAHVPYILGLQSFVVGATILCMHLLKSVHETALSQVKRA